MAKKSKTGSTKKKLKEAGNKIFHVGTYNEQHRKNLQQRAKKVQQLYKQAVDKITKAAQPTLFSADPNLSEFHFSDFPALNKAVDGYIKQMGAGLQSNIEEGDSEAWTLSNTKNDAMVDYLAGTYNIPKETLKEWKHPHLEALESFTERTMKGMNISNGGSAVEAITGVWNLTQFKSELELAFETGIGKGKSAVELAKDVKQYLKYPDKLFRRVRERVVVDKDGKKHRVGALRLSKATAAFHPGRGVYRSSYRNALRLTATENNIAYRTCDHTRWQALDFVLGQEIRLSNNHTLNGKPFTDICDELAGRYPKDFKFTGWHPWCRCYAVSILADEKEVNEYCQRIADGESVRDFKFTGKQPEPPEKFTRWIKDNEDRIVSAKSLPYFIKDNGKYVTAVTERVKLKITKSEAEELKNKGYKVETSSNGALKAIHPNHNFSMTRHGGEYEKKVAEIGFNSGHRVTLDEERHDVYKQRSAEGTWDYLRMEVAGTGKEESKNIRDALKHCASKTGTEAAIIFLAGDISWKELSKGIDRYNGLKKLNDGQWKQFVRIVFISPRGIINETVS